jgi:hypothetical protein
MPRKSKNQEKNSEEASDQPNTWSEVQQVRKWMRHQSTNGALHQVFRANPDRMPQRLPEPDPMLSTTGFLNSFLPSDGQESAIARLIVALTNTAMDLFARANTLESPAREAELSLAVRLSHTVAALSKALDHHRGRDWPTYTDDFTRADDCAGSGGERTGLNGSGKP